MPGIKRGSGRYPFGEKPIDGLFEETPEEPRGVLNIYDMLRQIHELGGSAASTEMLIANHLDRMYKDDRITSQVFWEELRSLLISVIMKCKYLD